MASPALLFHPALILSAALTAIRGMPPAAPRPPILERLASAGRIDHARMRRDRATTSHRRDQRRRLVSVMKSDRIRGASDRRQGSQLADARDDQANRPEK
jgi:hypothetical protein